MLRWLTHSEAMAENAEAQATWPSAHAMYAKAVEVADWLELPYRTIRCGSGRWVLASPPNGYAGTQEWRFRICQPFSVDPWFSFRMRNRIDAEDHGFAFGYLIDKSGEIGPYEETPEGKQAAWDLLDEVTRPVTSRTNLNRFITINSFFKNRTQPP